MRPIVASCFAFGAATVDLLASPPEISIALTSQQPATIAELVDHTVGKVLDSLGVEHELTPRWDGLPGHDD